jgi:hypothetical protein
MRNAALAAAAAILSVSPVLASPPVPVVLAVDTSRSLSRSELAAAVETLRAMVRQLPPDTPVGAIEFADATRWLARPDEARDRGSAATAALEPRGSFTLLNDALFETARALSRGGVIVLASDGRDENSATTTDDVARLCGANGVRIVTVGVGRRVDERALRRLALLTEGTFVGQQPSGAATDLLIAVESARRGIAEALARAAAPTPVAAARAVMTPVPAAPPAETGVSLPAWIPAVLVLAVIALATAVLLWRRQRREEQRACERCGLPLAPWDESCPHCRAEAERADSEIREVRDRESLARAVSETPGAPPPEAASPLGPELLARAPLDEPIDKTFILGEQAVLVVKEHRKVPRVVPIDPGAPLTVGRAPKVNSVSIADPTMSAQHFRIVLKEGGYYIADLETTNGTTVNGERTRVRRLQPGDHIRAGEVDFEFRVQLTPARRSGAGQESS